MTEYLVTLSLLILIVLLIRGVFHKTISPRVRYALWIVVVIRLFLPLSLFQVEVPFVNLPSEPEDSVSVSDVQPSTPPSEAITVIPSIPGDAPIGDLTVAPHPILPTIPSEPNVDVTWSELPESPREDSEPEKAPIDWQKIIHIVWMGGSAALALWFLITGCIFYHRLHADRQLYKTIRKTKVYVTQSTGAPCLAGLIPAIYITPEAAAGKSQTLIMIHEYTHMRHGDHIWALVRILALIVHWWNPLVWAAAILSKQDAELACDDAIAAKLTDDKRFEYAHILLDTIPQKHRHVVGLGSGSMKERILMLTKKQKNRILCVVLAILLTVCAIGCSFIGMKEAEGVETDTSEISDPTTDTHPIEEAPIIDQAGPFVGYVADAETPWIEVYTEVDGDYVTKIPYDIFDSWPATDRSNGAWSAHWMNNIAIYYEEFGDFRWAIIATIDSVLGSGHKNVATSSDGGETWQIGTYYKNYVGTVTGAGFASETVAFMSMRYYEDNGPEIARTLDGGKTWERLALDIPYGLQNKRMTPLIPTFSGKEGRYPILCEEDGKEDATVYLLSSDGGLTWEWDIDSIPLSNEYMLPFVSASGKYYSYMPAAVYGSDFGGGVYCQYDSVNQEHKAFLPPSDTPYYVVLGLQDSYKRYGKFDSLTTYYVRMKNGGIDEIAEVKTVTKELVRENGKPYTGLLDGMYSCGLYSESGLVNRTVLIEGNKITVSAYLDATDAGGTYEGTFTRNFTTGAITATMIYSYHDGNGNRIYSEPQIVSGKLYEYNGLMHFLCEKSDTKTLTPDNPLPLTFTPNINGSHDPEHVVLDSVLAGDWYHSYTDNGVNAFYYLMLSPETEQMRFYQGVYESEYANCYTGSYKVNPLTHHVTATLTDILDPSAPVITMELGFGYSLSSEGEHLILSIYSCDAKRYETLVGQTIGFSHEPLHPVNILTESDYIATLWSFLIDNGDAINCLMDVSGHSYLEHERANGTTHRIIEINKDTIGWQFANKHFEETMPLLAKKTAHGWLFYMSYWTAGTIFYEIELTGDDSLSFASSREISEEEAIAVGAFNDEFVTVTSLTELASYRDRHIISTGLYDFYHDLISRESDIPELRTVVIEDFAIRFTVPMTDHSSYFTFTVKESALDTLPVGSYERTVRDIREIIMEDPNAPDVRLPSDMAPEAEKLFTFINGSYIWNTPMYGEGTTYPGMHNYICNYYGGANSALPYEEYKRIAYEEFGVTDFDALGVSDFIREDGTVASGAMGGGWIGDILEVKEDDEETTIIMQFFHDASRLLKSHKIAYRFGNDGKWLGYEFLEKSNYEPNGLSYAEEH